MGTVKAKAKAPKDGKTVRPALVKASDISPGIGSVKATSSVPERSGRGKSGSKYQPLIDAYDALKIGQCFVFEPPEASETVIKTLRLAIHNNIRRAYNGFEDTEHKCKVSITVDGNALKISCIENDE